jgi:hypothetical protein
VGVAKRRVLQGLWRRLVGVGIIGPGLYWAPDVYRALPRPDPLTPHLTTLAYLSHNTRRYEHPLFGASWPYRGGAMLHLRVDARGSFP